MQITEIYVDDASETHLRDIQVNLEPRDFAPPSAPMKPEPGHNSIRQLRTLVQRSAS